MGKPVLDVLNGLIPPKPPVWFMRQAGRYLPEYRALRQRYPHFLETCLTPDLATTITLQPLQRFQLDAAIIFSDILVVPYGLGQYVEFIGGVGPKLSPLRHGDELRHLHSERLLEKLTPSYEALRLVKAALAPEATLLGFSGAPWTLATYMIEGGSSRDFKHTLTWAYETPKSFQALICLLEQAIVEHLSAQIEAGADAVQLFDSWAGSVPQNLFASLVLEPTRRIVTALRAKHPLVPVIGFPRGAGSRYGDYARRTGVQALGVDQYTSLPTLHENVPIPTQGNLDPFALRSGGAALETAITSLKQTTRGRAHIANLGHGILPDTPIAYVERFLELIRE